MSNKSFLKLLKIFTIYAFSAFLLSGCASLTQIFLPDPSGASRTQVVLLPDPNGKVGVFEVSTAKGRRTLNRAWQATESAGMDKVPSEPKILDKEEVLQTFREALAAEPLPPISFIIYFEKNSTILSTESLALLAKLLHVIEHRKSTDIIVSGHTDTVGSFDFNSDLSLRRAKAVAKILVARGIDRRIIQLTYHGKGNPLIPTRDGVSEPRNRRVEITVR